MNAPINSTGKIGSADNAFARGGVLETKIVGTMTRLGVLKLNTVAVEYTPADHRQAIIIRQLQILSIIFGGKLGGHSPFARHDLDVQFFFEVLINGTASNFLRQIACDRCEKIIFVQNQSLAVDEADAAHVIKFVADFKSAPFGCFFVGNYFFEPNNFSAVRKTVADRCLLERFDAADLENITLDRLVNDSGSDASYRLNITAFYEFRHGISYNTARTTVHTRMRFVLVDPKKADVKGIEAMKVVKGSFTQAGQFQVIIGNTVPEFYKDFTAVAGIEGVSKDAVKAAAGANQNILQRGAAIAAEIFAPLIPAIITGGLILGFRNCIDSLYLFENGTKTLVELSQFWAGMDQFLWLIGEAVFHLGIPVGICWSVVRKPGGTPILGIILGLTLVSGQLLNAYAVATTPPELSTYSQ